MTDEVPKRARWAHNPKKHEHGVISSGDDHSGWMWAATPQQAAERYDELCERLEANPDRTLGPTLVEEIAYGRVVRSRVV